MKRPHIQTYKKLLEAKREELLRSLRHTRDGVGNSDSIHLVRDPKEREAALQKLMDESRLLWTVESALQGIAQGLYGKCLFCQRDIPDKVLAVLPWSAYCTSCQRLAEAYVTRPVGARDSA
jgi:DnaK suppressor protein